MCQHCCPFMHCLLVEIERRDGPLNKSIQKQATLFSRQAKPFQHQDSSFQQQATLFRVSLHRSCFGYIVSAEESTIFALGFSVSAFKRNVSTIVNVVLENRWSSLNECVSSRQAKSFLHQATSLSCQAISFEKIGRVHSLKTRHLSTNWRQLTLNIDPWRLATSYQRIKAKTPARIILTQSPQLYNTLSRSVL